MKPAPPPPSSRLTDAARDELLKRLYETVKDQGELLSKVDAKQRVQVSQAPVKGPSGTWHAGDVKWWIALITGVAGAGLFGASAVQYRNPPEPLAEVVQREQQIKTIEENVATCQANVQELQKVVHSMRDKNISAFEKVGVNFQIEDGAPRMSAIGFTERVRKDKTKVYDALSFYPSLRNTPSP